MAEDLRLNVVTDSDSRGLVQAERELAATEKQAGKTGDAMEGAAKDSDKLEHSLHDQTDQIRKLQAEYARTRKSVHDLQTEWLDADRENDQIVRRDLRRERSRLGELQRVAKEMESTLKIRFNTDLTDFAIIGERAGEQVAATATRSLTSAFQGLGPMPALIAAGVALGTPMAIGLTAMLGGAITGALGTGAMAAGILSSIKNPQVQAAAKEFGAELSGEFFGGTEFERPVIAALGILRDAVRSLNLHEMLAPLAATVPIIAQGIAEFIVNLKNAGLDDTLRRMPEFALIAAEGFASMGKAVGFFFDEISKDQGAADGLRAFFGAFNATIRITGALIANVEQQFHALSIWAQGFTEMAASINRNAPDWMGFQQINQMMRNITGIVPTVSGQMVFLSNSEQGAARNAEEQAAALQQLRDELQNTERALTDMINTELGMDNANVAVNKGWLDLRETLQQNGKHWEDNTRAGLANKQAVLDQVAALERQREQTIANTDDVRGANAEFDRQVQKLKDIAHQAGLTGAALDDLVGTYPIKFQLSVIGNAASAIVNQFASLFQGAFRASGGPVEAGRPYVVGEKRPELFVPRSSGYVYPDVSMGASGGGGRYVVDLRLNGRTLREFAIDDALARGISQTDIALAYP